MFYETIDDITADAGIRVKGSSPEEVICKAILATFNEITDIEMFSGKISSEITVEGKFPYLLADLINRVLHLHETEGFVCSSCNITELTKNRIKVHLIGEKFDPSRHPSKLLIKAATYHRLRFEREGDEWIAEVIFDI
jgi:SHS2 domain-containing protein